MIDGLKPYPAMKDPGVPWLGEVPEAWNVLRGRDLFKIYKRVAGELGHPVLSVTQAGLRVKDVNSGEGQVSQDYSKYQIVEPDEFVMNSMDLLTGGVGIADTAGVTSPDYRVFAIRDRGVCRDRYVLHVLRMLYANRGFYAWGQGSAQLGRWRLPRKRFNEFPFPVPPLSEQAAIVRYLDHVDRRIRRYIHTKQKLIKLLQEQKQVIIHRAVTRGLDPNVRLKASGVEWLGNVPEHWEVVRSGSMFRLFGGFAFPGSGFVRDESDETLPVLLTPVNFDPAGGLRFGPKSTVRFRGDVPIRFRLRRGALVTVLTDLSAKRLILGRAGFIEHDEVLLNQRTARVDIHSRTRSRINPQYLCCVLNSYAVREQSISTSRGSTVFHTSPTRMLAARWTLPPLDEQLAIVDKLETLDRAERETCARLNKEICLLREYRTRLIADVVTGKLDVRDAAASLPDESEEPETIDEADTLADDEREAEADDLDASREEVDA